MVGRTGGEEITLFSHSCPRSRLSPHKAKTRTPSPFPCSALLALLSTPLLGSTCLHNRDRMQIPIPTELQTAACVVCARSAGGGRGYSFQKLPSIPRPPAPATSDPLSVRHPSLETCSGADRRRRRLHCSLYRFDSIILQGSGEREREGG